VKIWLQHRKDAPFFVTDDDGMDMFWSISVDARVFDVDVMDSATQTRFPSIAVKPRL
jgi:hypothetical protein